MKIRSNLKEGQFLILPQDVGPAVLDYLRKTRVEMAKEANSKMSKLKEPAPGDRASSKNETLQPISD